MEQKCRGNITQNAWHLHESPRCEYSPIMSAALRIDNLQKSYGSVQAVRGVSFEVKAGEILGLLGPNGAGKTTTLECIIGLREPDGGTILINGLDVRKRSREVKEWIGVALQNTALPDKITPREALRLFAGFYKAPARVNDLIERFSLSDKIDAKFETLSGGQKQRLAVALALVNDPAILFLDEPTAALDPQSRRGLHDAIRSLREAGKTVILTTHYIEEAEQLCDRVEIIDHGRIIASGKPVDLIAAGHSSPKVTFTTARPIPKERLQAFSGAQATITEAATVTLQTAQPGRTIIELVKWLEADPDNELIDLRIHKPSLEDIFIEKTGRTLRD